MTTSQRSAADDKAADAEYITAVRGGDRSAFAPLYKRHQAAAYHLARQLVTSPSEAEDLVSESFAKVFNTLLSGGGPDSAFRAYLLTSVRNTFYDAVRQGKKLSYTDNLEPLVEGEEFEDPTVKGLDNALAAKAFATLPERWQAVLWHTEIEGESPAQVAPLLGLTANGVAALAYRAREGLKQAFLQAHVADVATDDCKVTNSRLGAWSRGGLSTREQRQVDAHLEVCDRCAAVAAEISDLGTGLRGVVAVLAIGTPTLTAAYLAGGSMAKIGALAWAGATAPAAGLAKITGLVTGAGVLAPGMTTGVVGATTGVGATAGAGIGATAVSSTAATTAAGVFVESSSSSAAAAGAAAHSARGLWGAVAGTAAVAAIATIVIVSANFGDPEPSADDVGLAPSTSSDSADPTTGDNSSSAPSSTKSPSAPGTNRESGGLDLPSIPAVDDDFLGALPSIGALPKEEDAEESGSSDESPAPADEGTATENPGATEEPPPATGEPTTPPETEEPTEPEEPTTPSQPTDPTDEPEPPLPAAPTITPDDVTLTLDNTTDPETPTYASGPIVITHQGEVDYSAVSITIPTFTITPATPEPDALADEPTPLTAECFVEIQGAAPADPVPCGDEEVPFDLLQGGAPLTAGETVTFSVTIKLDQEGATIDDFTAEVNGTYSDDSGSFDGEIKFDVTPPDTSNPDEGGGEDPGNGDNEGNGQGGNDQPGGTGDSGTDDDDEQ
ncbi:sigma-70 family RNA polymerase sigma factor [Cumulibacter soli]|uniref:sigma-70 family RNA polymerase sigma factor n=1 Tax=Cumulibacter soli TaxID=2546344 RepID=UPI001068B91E|nr:sigma-70 family RNA polymerase sigma factor [Cumulibacter soli]